MVGIYNSSEYTNYTKLKFNIESIKGTGNVYINELDQGLMDANGNYVQTNSIIDTNETEIIIESEFFTDLKIYRIKVESGTQITFSSIGVTYYDADGNQTEFVFDTLEQEPINNGYEETLNTTPPIITLTGDAVVNIEVGENYDDAGATATDTNDGVLTVTESGDTVNTNVPGTYTIRYNAVDSAGNHATEVTRTVIVSDTTSPIITLTGDAVVNIEVGENYDDAGATATDTNDGVLTVTESGDTVNTNVPGTYTIRYNAVDSAGNHATEVTRTVIVSDTTSPIITLTGDAVVNIEVGENYDDAGATATDTNDGVLTVTESGDTVNTNVPGTYTIRYNAVDSAGNHATEVTRTVIVSDTTSPIITLTGDAVVNIEVGENYDDAGATATDTNDGVLTVTESGDTVNTNVPGTYTIRYNAVDSAGNHATEVTRTVIVSDTTSPVITLTGDAVVNIEVGENYDDAGATATDTNDGVLTVTESGDTVNTNVPGTYTIRYNAVDSAGNHATEVTRTVIVSDTTSPIITLTGDAVVNIEVGENYDDAGATATDTNDGVLTVTESGDTVNTNVPGTYTIRYNAVDSAGNHATEVTRTVIVSDTTSPVITLIGSNNIQIYEGIPYYDAGATAIDNGTDDLTDSIIITVLNDTDTNGIELSDISEMERYVDTSALSTYTIKFNVADNNGNNAIEVIRTVTVVPKPVPKTTVQIKDELILSITEENTSNEANTTVLESINALANFTLDGDSNNSDNSGGMNDLNDLLNNADNAGEVPIVVVPKETTDAVKLVCQTLFNSIDNDPSIQNVKQIEDTAKNNAENARVEKEQAEEALDNATENKKQKDEALSVAQEELNEANNQLSMATQDVADTEAVLTEKQALLDTKNDIVDTKEKSKQIKDDVVVNVNNYIENIDAGSGDVLDQLSQQVQADLDGVKVELSNAVEDMNQAETELNEKIESQADDTTAEEANLNMKNTIVVEKKIKKMR